MLCLQNRKGILNSLYPSTGNAVSLNRFHVKIWLVHYSISTSVSVGLPSKCWAKAKCWEWMPLRHHCEHPFIIILPVKTVQFGKSFRSSSCCLWTVDLTKCWLFSLCRRYILWVSSVVQRFSPEKACLHLLNLNESVSLSVILEYDGSTTTIFDQSVEAGNFYACTNFKVRHQI